MNSLLSKAKKIDVCQEPFPHLIIYEPLEDAICLQLLAEYPEINTITYGLPFSNNQRFSYSASYALSNENISPLWKDLVRTHVSVEFLREIISLFDDDIRATYPWFEEKIGKLETLRAGIRNIDSFATADVLLDAQICINTPVKKASSVRGAHVDHPNKLFAGLFYLKHPEDTSTGADLDIYRFLGERNCFKMAEVATPQNLELVKTVKYERNVFIFFLNSIEALHGVSVRSKTEMPRYLFNLVGEVSEPLFHLAQYQHPAAKLFLAGDWFSSQVEAAAALPKRAGRKLQKLIPQISIVIKMPNRAHQKQFGRIFSMSLDKAVEKGSFSGPALHVGSKINYDDEKARESAPRFRKFITSNLKENQEFLGLDIFPGHNVDIVADLCSQDLFASDLLQYKSYFKTIICWAVLEHVSNPIQAAINIDQFLAPGGKLFYCGPWVWGYHPYPDDYWRISFPGLKILFPHLEWQDWWYSGTKKDVAFRINKVKNERKVFLEKYENANQNNLVSDRSMPYLNINAIGIKKLS